VTPHLYLFDDERARNWSPFRATRPVGELIHGCLLQRERWERVLGISCAGHLAGPELLGFAEEGAPPVLAPEDVDGSADRTVVSSRAVPSRLVRLPDLDGPTTILMDGEVVGWHLPAGTDLPAGGLADPSSAPVLGHALDVDGTVLGWPWELIDANRERIAQDAAHLLAHGGAFLLTNVHLLGDRPISLGHDVQVEAGVVMDLREGPIRLEDGVRVRSPARLTGPLWIGRDTVVLGGEVAHSSIGPACRVRGEIECSVVLGYSNKAHDGYLGHAYVGRWVNLGALTTNSDLKNSYSPVRVQLAPDHVVDTGLLKVGCFLGDHVKTGIGTLLNTGTVVGAGSNLFGGELPPLYVPPFSWGSGEDLVPYRLDKFLEVALIAMGRRGVQPEPGALELLRRAWEASRGERGGG
jgi:UDP-N-acetylglucosamine diphosphorylase/glucosamine-1-phosphate N-acetyltransferase